MVAQRAPQDHKQHQHACEGIVLIYLACVNGNEQMQICCTLLPYSTAPGSQARTTTPRPHKQDCADSTDCSARKHRLLRQAQCKQAL